MRLDLSVRSHALRPAMLLALLLASCCYRGACTSWVAAEAPASTEAVAPPRSQSSRVARALKSLPPAPAAPTSLNVALYPYVPRPQQFQAALQRAWSSYYPTITLNFQNYDCYSNDPPPNLDVFVSDSTFLDYFVSKGYLRQLDIGGIWDWTDFLPFAWAGGKYQASGPLYGVPYLGCLSVLITRKGDQQLYRQNSLAAVAGAIGQSTTPNNPRPPPGQGLLVDLTGGTTDAAMYLMTGMQLAGQWTATPTLPPADQLDPAAVSQLNLLEQMAGCAQATYNDPGTDRATWFASGSGRALVGFTETLASLPPGTAGNYQVWGLPYANAYNFNQIMYVDVASINALIDPAKLPYATVLLNLMTGLDVMYQSMIPDQPGHSPQFLFPVRGTLLADLTDVDPVYLQLIEIYLNFVDHPFHIGAASRSWLASTKAAIRAAILGPNCKPLAAAEQAQREKGGLRRAWSTVRDDDLAQAFLSRSRLLPDAVEALPSRSLRDGTRRLNGRRSDFEFQPSSDGGSAVGSARLPEAGEARAPAASGGTEVPQITSPLGTPEPR